MASFSGSRSRFASRRARVPGLVDISVDFGLHFDGAAQQGGGFHLIGTLSEYGKLGTMCIGESRASAEKFYRDAVAVLNREANSER